MFFPPEKAQKSRFQRFGAQRQIVNTQPSHKIKGRVKQVLNYVMLIAALRVVRGVPEKGPGKRASFGKAPLHNTHILGFYNLT